ncbi:carbohydrate ABC transporter permease [Salinibacterium soli]|uniref:Sugar ABC transporter permease n=1 Tax=Antiquaquibacter soli TaxID=3064523 RepID=A0ABT9BHX5_9MICO|nr:sugar ABC transporter permease [Protaetiibacter sp. WY-16]MDO7880623.1 sugar ABC transporter permease [Protaetiibacter sp. WY-16]
MTSLPTSPAVLPSPGARPGGGARARLHSRRRNAAALYALPAFAWFVIFLVGPLASVFVMSMQNGTTLIAKSEFVGLRNFERVFADPLFWKAMSNTALQLVIVVPIMVVLGFMLGYYLFLKPPFAGALRIIFFTSSLLSASTKAMIFYSLLSPNGLVNQLLSAVGLDALTTSWLANSATALPVIMIVDLWAGIGFLAILFSAQLTSVSGDIIEASRIDGCGHWRSMWHVAFGMVQGFVGVIAMLQFLWTLFLSATNVLLLTKGGPGTSSQTLSFLIYTKAFEQSDIGYSQAVGVVLFVTGILGAILIRSVLRSRT